VEVSLIRSSERQPDTLVVLSKQHDSESADAARAAFTDFPNVLEESALPAEVDGGNGPRPDSGAVEKLTVETLVQLLRGQQGVRRRPV
jgi:hypothetical protein